jgi:hypothetical protein
MELLIDTEVRQGQENVSTLEVSRQWPLGLLIEARLGEGKTLGSEKGKELRRGLF